MDVPAREVFCICEVSKYVPDVSSGGGFKIPTLILHERHKKTSTIRWFECRIFQKIL